MREHIFHLECQLQQWNTWWLQTQHRDGHWDLEDATDCSNDEYTHDRLLSALCEGTSPTHEASADNGDRQISSPMADGSEPDSANNPVFHAHEEPTIEVVKRALHFKVDEVLTQVATDLTTALSLLDELKEMRATAVDQEIRAASMPAGVCTDIEAESAKHGELLANRISHMEVTANTKLTDQETLRKMHDSIDAATTEMDLHLIVEQLRQVVEPPGSATPCSVSPNVRGDAPAAKNSGLQKCPNFGKGPRRCKHRLCT